MQDVRGKLVITMIANEAGRSANHNLVLGCTVTKEVQVHTSVQDAYLPTSISSNVGSEA